MNDDVISTPDDADDVAAAGPPRTPSIPGLTGPNPLAQALAMLSQQDPLPVSRARPAPVPPQPRDLALQIWADSVLELSAQIAALPEALQKILRCLPAGPASPERLATLDKIIREIKGLAPFSAFERVRQAGRLKDLQGELMTALSRELACAADPDLISKSHIPSARWRANDDWLVNSENLICDPADLARACPGSALYKFGTESGWALTAAVWRESEGRFTGDEVAVLALSPQHRGCISLSRSLSLTMSAASIRRQREAAQRQAAVRDAYSKLYN